MAGASKQHNLIVANIIRVLGNQLLERDCNVYPSDMRVRIVKTGKYTYPDVTVVCGAEQFEDEHLDILLNPAVIIEVLSETTEAYDRGKKFENYQYIDSLCEYILVAQEPYRIERYIRQPDKTWTYSSFHEAEERVELSTIGCELSLKDVYTKVVSLSQDRG
jgi:Uma2 family endonuclease